MVLRACGTTLLELLVVLGLIALVLAAVSPRMGDVLAAAELRSGALRLSSALTRARFAALAQGSPWLVRVVDERSFTVGSPAGVDHIRLPGLVRIVATTSGGDVRFQPNGWAENATFTLEHHGRVRRVVVNQRGRVVVGAAEAP